MGQREREWGEKRGGRGKLGALAPHLTSYPSLPSLPIALNPSLFAEAGTGSGIDARLAFAAIGPSSAAQGETGQYGARQRADRSGDVWAERRLARWNSAVQETDMREKNKGKEEEGVEERRIQEGRARGL